MDIMMTGTLEPIYTYGKIRRIHFMKEKFVDKVLDFCNEEKLLEKGDRIVVGVSGGADSVCLLQFLYEIRETWELSLYVLHVHHGIRGQEADRDAALVKEMADRLFLPFCLVKKNVPEIVKKEGLTEEETGRKVRYEAFEEYRREVGADKIAVAHHEDDQAETVLFHLFRGTGPRGLCGIPARRGPIIRPLLCVTRQEIETFVCENELDYVIDGTNLVPQYTRNKIRIDLIPYVQREINEQAIRHIAQAAEKNVKWSRYIERQGEKAAERIIQKRDGNIFLSLEEFEKEDSVIRDEVIRLVFAEFVPGGKDIGQIHYKQVKLLAKGSSGCQAHFPGNVVAVREYGQIRFGRPKLRDKEIFSLACPIPSSHIVDGNGERFRISLHVEDRSDLPVQIPQKDYTKWLDYDKIEGGLVLRNPKEGDYFILNDKGDKKKLSRYYMDLKIPAGQRVHQLVLADGSHVVWAIPGRISHACRISEQTNKVLVVTKERDLL